MTEAKDPKSFRPNVGLALFHREGPVLLGKRVGTEGPYQWQMPQGGVDRGEKPRDAAYRELEEEVGVTPAHVDLLEEAEDWLYYEFPTELRKKLRQRGRYVGQRQKWFAFRFKGRDADVRLDAHSPEFSDWRWAALESTPGLVIPFKRATYEEVARRFKKYTVGASK
ncbi:MAG: RNA pyrophosphohydrolase [Proteobacteria bacterium]|nr:RNA pyrophosphohydrolase [Pseudomonadota bacterium]